jgi:Uma2 family endonuclease
MESINHSLTQAKIAALLINDDRFSIMTELSLDISQLNLSQFGLKDEIKPDVCAYPKEVGLQESDIVKMTDMPLLAIEILSPSQGTKELKDKIHVYFELGVKSCWLVVPDLKTISVFSQATQFKNFDMRDDDLIDEVMDIRIPIQKVF